MVQPHQIEALCNLIESDRIEHRLKGSCADLEKYAKQGGRRAYEEFGYDLGRKYIRIKHSTGTEVNRTQTMVSYFVDVTTGVIYGADGWKKPNFKRQYGTLDTMNEWAWGEYYAVSKLGLDTLVPKDQRKKKNPQ